MPLRLQIETIRGAIGLESTSARLDPGQPHPEVHVQSRPARIEIETRPVVVHIDYDVFQNNVGMSPALSLGKKLADRSRQDGVEDMGLIAAEGDAVATIETRVSMADVAGQALADNGPGAASSYQLFPPYPPMQTTGGGITFQPVPGELQIEAPGRPVRGTYHPGSVRMYPRAWPELRITVVGTATNVLV